MPELVEFQPNFNLSISYIVLTGVLSLCLISWIWFVFWSTRKIEQKNLSNLKPKLYTPPDISALKEKYIQLISQVQDNYKLGQISERTAHQNISLLSRFFVYEIKGHRVDTFTLSDLKQSRYQSLVPVIEKAYGPMFSKDLQGSVEDVALSAKKVVQLWS